MEAHPAAAEIRAKTGERRDEVQAWREVKRFYAAAGQLDDARSAAERAAPAAAEVEGADEPVRILRGWADPRGARRETEEQENFRRLMAD